MGSDDNKLLGKAIELAKTHHAGVFDKGGHPYIEHPLRLMENMDTNIEKMVAVMHDLVEDTHITIAYLRSAGFSEKVLSALDCVTNRDNEDYESFIERIAQNPLATKVKLADLEDNMDLSRIPEPSKKDYKRIEKYKRAKTRLSLKT
jgi:(p)ppGpp synthase/HD superfamily hydrolase